MRERGRGAIILALAAVGAASTERTGCWYYRTETTERGAERGARGCAAETLYRESKRGKTGKGTDERGDVFLAQLVEEARTEG
jgi:hypothetical protein